jgi:hypothetical protein
MVSPNLTFRVGFVVILSGDGSIVFANVLPIGQPSQSLRIRRKGQSY